RVLLHALAEVANARGERDLVGLAGNLEELRILELERGIIACPCDAAARMLAGRFEPRAQRRVAFRKRAAMAIGELRAEEEREDGRAECPGFRWATPHRRGQRDFDGRGRLAPARRRP